MKVAFTPIASTALLGKLRELIDGKNGGEVRVLDADDKVLFRFRLRMPCAPDPKDGAMVLHEPIDRAFPEAAGRAFKAIVAGDVGTLVELDVGEEGSDAAIELSKLDLTPEDAVRARSRLTFKW